jgi:hypothetical protein
LPRGGDRCGLVHQAGEDRLRIVLGDVPDLELERAPFRHDVEGSATFDAARMQSGIGHVVVDVARAGALDVVLQPAKHPDEVAGEMNGVERLRGEGRMTCDAAARRPRGELTLWPVAMVMPVGSPTIANRGRTGRVRRASMSDRTPTQPISWSWLKEIARGDAAGERQRRCHETPSCQPCLARTPGRPRP